MKSNLEFNKASLEIDGAVAILRMNDPDVLNALSPDMVKGLTQALDELAASDAKPRCLVLTGSGRAFSAGANLQGRGGNGLNKPGGAGQTLETVFHPFIRKLRDLPYPIVTAVNGAAAGAGMSVALMGDLILCARSAYFLQAFRRIGLVPDCGSTWLLPRLVGRARAIELSLLGERLPAETALAWGLVNRVVPLDRLRDETLALARQIASSSRNVVALGKAAFYAQIDMDQTRAYEYTKEVMISNALEPDATEGIAAFLERRRPVWRGEGIDEHR